MKFIFYSVCSPEITDHVHQKNINQLIDSCVSITQLSQPLTREKFYDHNVKLYQYCLDVDMSNQRLSDIESQRICKELANMVLTQGGIPLQFEFGASEYSQKKVLQCVFNEQNPYDVVFKFEMQQAAAPETKSISFFNKPVQLLRQKSKENVARLRQLVEQVKDKLHLEPHTNVRFNCKDTYLEIYVPMTEPKQLREICEQSRQVTWENVNFLSMSYQQSAAQPALTFVEIPQEKLVTEKQLSTPLTVASLRFS